MGFEHNVIRKPKELQGLIEAIKDFQNYLEANNIKKNGGLPWYGLFKSENEVFERLPLNEIQEAATVGAQWATRAIERIDDKSIAPDEMVELPLKYFFPEYVEELRQGKCLIHWPEIEWLHNFPTSILNSLYQACKKHNCLWFLKEIVETSNNGFAEATKCILDVLPDGYALVAHGAQGDFQIEKRKRHTFIV